MKCRLTFVRDLGAKVATVEVASDADWGIAVEREAVIRLLAERDQLTPSDVDEMTVRLGIGRSLFYKLLRKLNSGTASSNLGPTHPLKELRFIRILSAVRPLLSAF